MKKKAFIFDLWNTLLVKNGKKETELVSDHFKLPRSEVHNWIRISSVGKNGDDKYKIFESLCFENDITFTDSDKFFVDSLYQSYLNDCEWIDGAKELLKELKRLGYIIGILSNTTELSHTIIKHFGLNQLVDYIVLSCDVGFLKPDPRIFNSILRDINITSSEAYMVGDKINTDILGAKTIAMDSILYDPKIEREKLSYNTSNNGIVNNIYDVIHFAH